VLFELPACIGERPAANTHEEIKAIAPAPLVVLAAALITEPTTITCVIVPSEAVFTTTCRARLVSIGELLE
jgi:hypothetical protein